jgi:F-type H+-transporting ATPase subunit alpha
MKMVAGKLRLDLAQFRELEAFAQFASDLDKATQDQIRRGQKLTEVLKQPQYQPLTLAQQVSIIYAANTGLLDSVDTKSLGKFKTEWFQYLSAQAKELESKLMTGDKLSEAEEKSLVDAINNFKNNLFQA